MNSNHFMCYRLLILLALMMMINYTIVFGQKEALRIVRANVVQIDSSSLIYPLLDTVFAIDKRCTLDTCSINYVSIICSKVKPFSEQIQTYHFEVIDGDYTVAGDSIKGVTFYKDRTIFWINEIPNMLCNNTNQQEIFQIVAEDSLPTRDNIPISYCYYYYGVMFIYKRVGCLSLDQDDMAFPIVINYY